MKKTEITFPCGELSLEGMLNMPDGMAPFPAVVICHPHPLYGGSMDNNVVNSLFEGLTRASLISFKFNFRGVGRSQGEFSQGIGEQEDVSAAISFIAGLVETEPERLGLVGYSAGAAFAFPVGTKDTRIKALAAISPPLSMFDFKSLRHCLKPKLLISGSRDNFTDPSQFRRFCQSLPEPKEYDTIEGADHFWWGYEPALTKKIAAFFTKALSLSGN